MQQVEVAIVGAGQAGLSVSRSLSLQAVEHVVLERHRVAQTWRDRWESFCLVTPNWAIDLPDGAYEGDDPDGYMPRDAIVAWLEAYADSTSAPVHEGVDVASVQRDNEGFRLTTSEGTVLARALVLCTGAYQRPYRPPGAEQLPDSVIQLDATEYRGPGGLPPGGVLIVGSGQTGCQLAEELHQDGRRVVLACGKAPWVPRRLGGRDIVWWLMETGFLDQPVSALPDPSARLAANPLATGHDGGHDLHYRTLLSMGIELTGHFLGVDGGEPIFADDLAASVAWGDDRCRDLMNKVRNLVAERGIDGFEIPEPEPFSVTSPPRMSLEDFGSVIFTGGFRPDYGPLVPRPDALDELGFPIQSDGESAVVEGLFFAGVHFLRKRKSSILLGIGEDAMVVGSRVAGYLSA